MAVPVLRPWPMPCKPLAAPAHDLRDVREGLDVVDVARLAPDAELRRERRTETGHGPLPFNGLHQGRLLAGDVGLAHEGDLHVEGEVGAEDALAQQTGLPRLLDGALGALDGAVVSVPNEDVAEGGAGGVASEDGPFEEGVRVALQDAFVVEGAGVALFAVDQDVLDVARSPREEAPFDGGGEGGAAPAAEARL